MPQKGAKYGGCEASFQVNLADTFASVMHAGIMVIGLARERTIPVLSNNDILAIARASFERYKQHRQRDGLEVEYRNYDDQPETLIKSGIDQAKDIERKVSMIGCSICANSQASGDAVEAFTDAEVEMLAREEHDRWVRDREADGWTFGEMKDVDAKKSPFLVPWEELTEQIRDYDRQPVLDIIPLLHSAGFVVVRV